MDMKYGIEDKNGTFVCSNCFKPVKSDKINFCPLCGNPIKRTAVQLHEERMNNAKLEIIGKIIDSTNDKKTLANLKKMIEDITD